MSRSRRSPESLLVRAVESNSDRWQCAGADHKCHSRVCAIIVFIVIVANIVVATGVIMQIVARCWVLVVVVAIPICVSFPLQCGSPLSQVVLEDTTKAL